MGGLRGHFAAAQARAGGQRRRQVLQHEGFDWEGIQTAWEKTWPKGRIVAGGSTISQQLAKTCFIVAAHAVAQGGKTVITVMLEAVMDKRRILKST